jgi:hypothetical protein
MSKVIKIDGCVECPYSDVHCSVANTESNEIPEKCQLEDYDEHIHNKIVKDVNDFMTNEKEKELVDLFRKDKGDELS